MTTPAAPRLLAALVASSAVLALLAVAVSDRTYLVGETALVEAANDVPTAIGWPFRLVMQVGTLWVALLVVAAAAWATRRQGPRPALAVLLAVLIAFRLDNLLKDVVERPRPPGLVRDLHVREHIDGFGFPSGHTTMAFALATALHPLLPARWRPLAWALATVVGLARMHVGVHWPGDVVGGAALGVAIGAASWLVVAAVGPRDERSTPARQR